MSAIPTVAEKLTALVKTLPVIPFSFAWLDAENYVPGALTGEHAPVLGVGERVYSQHLDGRQFVFIGTELGNVAIFNRSAKHMDVVAWDASATLCAFVNCLHPNAMARVTSELFDVLVGNTEGANNIGQAFRDAIEEVRAPFLAMHGAAVPPTPEAEPAKAAPAPEAAPEMPKAEEPKAASSTNNEKESTMKSTTKATTAKTNDLTSWGVFWRAAGLATLILAIIVALIFGLHFGAAYIGGLGLSEGVQIALGYFITFAAYLGIGFTISKSVDWFGNLFSRRAPAKAPAAPMAAAAA